MKTFDEWSALGYRIKKGSKAMGRNAQGVPVFGENQVWSPSRNYGNQFNRVFDTYDHWELECDDVDYDDPLTYDNWMGK